MRLMMIQTKTVQSHYVYIQDTRKTLESPLMSSGLGIKVFRIFRYWLPQWWHSSELQTSLNFTHMFLQLEFCFTVHRDDMRNDECRTLATKQCGVQKFGLQVVVWSQKLWNHIVIGLILCFKPKISLLSLSQWKDISFHPALERSLGPEGRIM